MAGDDAGFHHLDGPGRLVALTVLRSRLVVNTAVAAAILLSWAALAVLAAGAARTGIPAADAPGGALLRLGPDVPLPQWVGRLASACLGVAGSGDGLPAFLLFWAMWVLMAVAMMLPSAAPLIRTYCEIADTAGAKGEKAVHPLVLVGGYLSVWAVASLLFAGLGLALDAAAPASGSAAATALGIAGLYQFSRLKEACLDKCRSPFAILFSRWSDRPSRIFRLGAEQGLWCLGCCWALMLVMFAVGIMNLFWMALIGLFTVVEKQWDGRLAGRLAGAILLVWAAALLIASR